MELSQNFMPSFPQGEHPSKQRGKTYGSTMALVLGTRGSGCMPTGKSQLPSFTLRELLWAANDYLRCFFFLHEDIYARVSEQQYTANPRNHGTKSRRKLAVMACNMWGGASKMRQSELTGRSVLTSHQCMWQRRGQGREDRRIPESWNRLLEGLEHV